MISSSVYHPWFYPSVVSRATFVSARCGRRRSSPSRSHSPVANTSRLHLIGIDARCPPGRIHAFVCLFLAVVIDVKQIERVDMAGDVPEQSQADVDEQI